MAPHNYKNISTEQFCSLFLSLVNEHEFIEERTAEGKLLLFNWDITATLDSVAPLNIVSISRPKEKNLSGLVIPCAR